MGNRPRNKATPEKCRGCGRALSQDELEVGTAHCHRCGHAHYAARTEDYRQTLAKMRRLSRRLCKAAGFASPTAAEAFLAEHDRRELAEGQK